MPEPVALQRNGNISSSCKKCYIYLNRQIYINRSVSKPVLLLIDSEVIRPALLLSGKLVSKTNFGNAFILSASN